MALDEIGELIKRTLDNGDSLLTKLREIRAGKPVGHITITEDEVEALQTLIEFHC